MAGRTRRPLNVVLAPGSPAEAAYESAILAPGFEPEPGLDLRYFGGRTIEALTFTHVYLGDWDAADRAALDRALPAAMADRGLNEVIAQYFQGPVSATFAGATLHATAPATAYKDTVESLVGDLDSSGALRGLDLASSVVCLLLPRGTVLVDGDSSGGGGPDSKHGLGGYHGSVHVGAATVLYAVGVYSEGGNGIVAFPEPWQNVCATFYHELQEARTDPDVEDAIRAGTSPDASKKLGWYSPQGGEIGDIPMAEARGDVSLVLKEVPLADGTGTVPVQLMWSNRVSGPEEPPAGSSRP